MARLVGIPPHKIADLDRSTNNNIEHQGIEFVTDCIVPWCTRLEQEANVKLFAPRAQGKVYTKLSVQSLMRGDSKSRAEFYRLMTQMGAMSINEVRALEDLNGIGAAGDARLVQLNQTTLEWLVENPDAKTGPPQRRRTCPTIRRHHPRPTSSACVPLRGCASREASMTVQFKAKGSRGEIWLYDQIGEDFWSGGGITDKQFQKELSALGNVSEISLRINSPGGDVFQGFAIYNMLKRHPANIVVDVDALAASIASIIAMAGDTIRMAKNAMMMIHNPQGMAYGDANEMVRVKALLDQIKGSLVDTYVDRTGQKGGDLANWMDDETWFTAESAVERGFADSVTRETTVNAFAPPHAFRNVPDAFKTRLRAAATPVLDLRRARITEQEQRVAAILR
jgi:ATP-dependent Clp protease protease subunit